MTFPKKYHFNYLKMPILLMLFFTSFVLGGNRDDLYELGRKAYSEKDHVTALKNLYAFYILNENSINNNKDFKSKIDEMIKTSDSLLRIGYSNKTILKIDSNGQLITEKVDKSFTVTGKEIQNILNSRSINNHRSLTSPSRGN